MKEKQNIVKYIDESVLPRKYHGDKCVIDWTKSVGISIPFIYDNIHGDVVILEDHYKNNRHNVRIYIEKFTDECGYIVSKSSLLSCSLYNIVGCKIINSRPEFCKYFVDLNDVYKYSPTSKEYVYMICPDCFSIELHRIQTVFECGFTCPCHSNGLSYPNRFMFALLQQSNMRFKREVTKNTDGFDWIAEYGNYKYDFCVFDEYNTPHLIEMDGYYHKFDIATQQRDAIKNKMAQDKNINLIRIDCCYPNTQERFDYIKNSIINSDVVDILSLQTKNIDWSACNNQAVKNIVKQVCEYWATNHLSTIEMSKLFNISDNTIRSYLKIGTEYNWCNYDSTATLAEALSRGRKNKNTKKRKVRISLCGEELGLFNTPSELSRQSKELFGIFFSVSGITKVCNKYRKSLYGYNFEYIYN